MATFTNQATLSFRSGSVTSNRVMGEIVNVLSASKNSIQNTYNVGDTITYVINITNSGNTALPGLMVMDNLGAYNPPEAPTLDVVPLTYEPNTLQYYANGQLQATPTITAENPLTVTGITVPAGGVATLIFNATVNNYAPLNQANTITNTMTVNGPGLSDDATDSHTISANIGPNLSITKALSPNVVNENGEITYTFNIINSGNADATVLDNVAITDTFNPILRNISVTYDNTIWAPNTNYTYDVDTGLFASVPGQITVPAAEITRDIATGEVIVTPSVRTLTIRGTV